jgi:predicted nucleic acid-binding protein
MIVLDASAALLALLASGQARQIIAGEQLHVPHLIDSELASALRRRAAASRIGADDAWTALDTWRRLAVTRYPVFSLLDRIWALRDNVSAYDGSYVALAESLDCALVTADRRLAAAPGARCPITVVSG